MGKIKNFKIFFIIVLGLVWCDELTDVLKRLDQLEEKVDFLEAENAQLQDQVAHFSVFIYFLIFFKFFF